jgi:hypothetical protein
MYLISYLIPFTRAVLMPQTEWVVGMDNYQTILVMRCVLDYVVNKNSDSAFSSTDRRPHPLLLCDVLYLYIAKVKGLKVTACSEENFIINSFMTS